MEKGEQKELREAADRESEAAQRSALAKKAEEHQRQTDRYAGQHQCGNGGRPRVITRE